MTAYHNKLSFVFLLYFVVFSCKEPVDFSQDTFYLWASDTVCKPGESITIEVRSDKPIANNEDILWFVNGVELNERGQKHILMTDSVEKRYSIYAKNRQTGLTSDTLNIYGSFHPSLLKCIYNYIDRWNYSCALSVAIFNSSINYHFADGYLSLSNKIKQNTSTPHILYSITKSFVAASILELAGEGKLSLSDPICSFIPNLNSIYINTDTTIEELLTHRSGISDYTSNPQLIYNNPFNNNNWDAKTILEYIESPASQRRSFCYSSTNYILLGLVVESISKVPLNEYIREHFLSPLKIDGLSLAPQDNIPYDCISHPHSYPNTFMSLIGDGEHPIDITDIIRNVCELQAKCGWAAGGMIGTADLIAFWGYQLFSQNGFVDDSIQMSISSSVERFTELDPSSSAYGFGIRKIFYKHHAFIGSYGRSIGDENLMFYNSDKDVSIAILSSSNTKNDGNPNIDELLFSLYECL